MFPSLLFLEALLQILVKSRIFDIREHVIVILTFRAEHTPTPLQTLYRHPEINRESAFILEFLWRLFRVIPDLVQDV